MSTPSQRPPGSTGIPVLDDPTPPRPPVRHPLGLPAGTIRALLAFAVLGMLWTIVLTTKDGHLPLFFVYLIYLVILILAHYFAAHGNSIARMPGERHPLGLPRGSVRLLLVAGFIGLAVWFYYHPDEFEAPPAASYAMPFVLLTAFVAGWLITGMVRTASGGQLPFWFQDIEAWFAIVSMLGLAAETIILIFINPNIGEDLKIDPTHLEMALAGVIGFYFGARS